MCARSPIINTGTTTMRYLTLSNHSDIEICDYPDSGKIGVSASGSETTDLRRMFRAETPVDYHDRESTVPPHGGV